jgi:hypothetical protein
MLQHHYMVPFLHVLFIELPNLVHKLVVGPFEDVHLGLEFNALLVCKINCNCRVFPGSLDLSDCMLH